MISETRMDYVSAAYGVFPAESMADFAAALQDLEPGKHYHVYGVPKDGSDSGEDEHRSRGAEDLLPIGDRSGRIPRREGDRGASCGRVHAAVTGRR